VQVAGAEVWVSEPEGFRDFVSARSAALVRSAWLLTGEEAAAQDLVQTALEKTWLRWDRVTRKDAPEAYVRRVMLSTFLTWNRRRWRGELPVETLPEMPAVEDRTAAVDVRLAMATALRGLPARQRAVVVLRYFDDLTETQTADALGCSVGTVKSQAYKALGRLRVCPELRDALSGEEVGHEQG
jgi:RNA polymerase sigma-70 factor (sigma-E family)